MTSLTTLSVFAVLIFAMSIAMGVSLYRQKSQQLYMTYHTRPVPTSKSQLVHRHEQLSGLQENVTKTPGSDTRRVVIRAAPGEYLNITEVELIDDTGENVASDAYVETVGSSPRSTSPITIVDGVVVEDFNENTMWYSDKMGSDAFVNFIFSDPKNLRRIGFHGRHGYPQRTNGVEVELYNDKGQVTWSHHQDNPDATNFQVHVV